MDRHNTLITILVILFVIHSLVLSGFMLVYTHRITGKVAGQLELCLNVMPVINMSGCSGNLTQDIPFYCVVDVIDDDEVNISSQFLTSQNIFTISDLGVISFTPRNAHVGNHSVNITANDYKCKVPGSWHVWNFTVHNVNDAPVFTGRIPDQMLIQETQLRAFFLNNYFHDPDNDPLVFTHTLLNYFRITVLSTTEVIVTPLQCPSQEYVQFTATDPYMLSASSNIVKLNCTDVSGVPQGLPTSGSGGGGGSGSGTFFECIPKLACLEWEPCQEDSTQRKLCYDENGCSDTTFFLYRECEYIHQCHNNIRDWNEDGVDCGGPCPPCPTCEDGIQNGNEEGIDCGGSCPPCVNSQVLFGELRPEDEYGPDGILIRSWDLSILNVQAKQVHNLDQGIKSVPRGIFSHNASEVFYIKDGNIWQKNLQSEVSSRLTHDGSALSLALADKGILFSREKFIEDKLFPRIYKLDIKSMGTQLLFDSIISPMYNPSSVPRSGMTAYATRGFEVDFEKKSFKKYAPNYIFGKVILPERSSLHVFDYWGQEVLRIEDRTSDLFAPRISPDGNHMAYFSFDGTQLDIWVVSLDGRLKKRLTDTVPYNEVFPIFSVDGRILFTADYKGKYALYLADINGSNVSVLLESPNPLIAFDWHYSPSCFDGILNQDETDIDCGGICGPCGTCFDGIKNQNEIGVDCGGVCPPCKYEDMPLLFQQQTSLFFRIAIPLLLALAGLSYAFRKQLLSLLDRVQDILFGRINRHILLEDKHKNELLVRIGELELGLHEMDIKDLVLAFTMIARDYYVKISNLMPEFDYSELKEHIFKMKVHELLKIMLAEFSEEAGRIEFGSREIKEFALLKYIEELRFLIVVTSRKHPEKVKHHQFEMHPKGRHENMFAKTRELLMALEFHEVAVAKRKYSSLMKSYARLSDQDKTVYYLDLRRAHTYIKYVSKIK